MGRMGVRVPTYMGYGKGGMSSNNWRCQSLTNNRNAANSSNSTTPNNSTTPDNSTTPSYIKTITNNSNSYNHTKRIKWGAGVQVMIYKGVNGTGGRSVDGQPGPSVRVCVFFLSGYDLYGK